MRFQDGARQTIFPLTDSANRKDKINPSIFFFLSCKPLLWLLFVNPKRRVPSASPKPVALVMGVT